MALPRRCIDCSAQIPSGTRCRGHQAEIKRIRNADRPLARAVVTAHLSTHGAICPGWQRPAHHVRPDELTAEHVVALTNGGTPFHQGGEASVLCRPCNSSKGKR